MYYIQRYVTRHTHTYYVYIYLYYMHTIIIYLYCIYILILYSAFRSYYYSNTHIISFTGVATETKAPRQRLFSITDSEDSEAKNDPETKNLKKSYK